ncbi:hypothetical protein AMIS_26620 [Actinoplanes missouriensis 431]|uniref:Uncharacterized protein n=2 Tax=Actinoplanes missouriensis TaxID=1866 RepID=I0H4E5_ACTM4|nr:hypothetical protein AMIS_26620 [Actinoplanes missouriensis 431]
MGCSMLAIVATAGCATRHFEKQAELTAHRTESHGDGYRSADEPEAIVQLVEKYAEENGGQVLGTEVEHGDRPGGRVDVLFFAEAAKWEPEGPECWRFSFRQPPNDPYVRDILHSVIDCPEDVVPAKRS